jgi:hypothetical protein
VGLGQGFGHNKGHRLAQKTNTVLGQGVLRGVSTGAAIPVADAKWWGVGEGGDWPGNLVRQISRRQDQGDTRCGACSTDINGRDFGMGQGRA